MTQDTVLDASSQYVIACGQDRGGALVTAYNADIAESALANEKGRAQVDKATHACLDRSMEGRGHLNPCGDLMSTIITFLYLTLATAEGIC